MMLIPGEQSAESRKSTAFCSKRITERHRGPDHPILNLFNVWSVLGSCKPRIKCCKALRHMLKFKGAKNPERGITDPRKLWTLQTCSSSLVGLSKQPAGWFYGAVSKHVHVYCQNEEPRFERALLGTVK